MQYSLKVLVYSIFPSTQNHSNASNHQRMIYKQWRKFLNFSHKVWRLLNFLQMMSDGFHQSLAQPFSQFFQLYLSKNLMQVRYEIGYTHTHTHTEFNTIAVNLEGVIFSFPVSFSFLMIHGNCMMAKIFPFFFSKRKRKYYSKLTRRILHTRLAVGRSSWFPPSDFTKSFSWSLGVERHEWNVARTGGIGIDKAEIT